MNKVGFLFDLNQSYDFKASNSSLNLKIGRNVLRYHMISLESVQVAWKVPSFVSCTRFD